MKIILTLITALLFLAGCSGGPNSAAPGDQNGKPSEKPNQSEPSKPPITKPEPAQPSNPQPNPSKASPSHQDYKIEAYFPEQNQVKYFKGTGNEFAEEKETVYERQGDYLPTIVSNGGTNMLKIYKLTNQGIFLVYQEPEYYEDDVPPIASLEEHFQEVPVLTDPIKHGVDINGWKITAVNKTILLPIGTVRHVIILELTNEDGSISRQYWAPKFGIVKKEFYFMHSDGSETVITSELIDTD